MTQLASAPCHLAGDSILCRCELCGRTHSLPMPAGKDGAPEPFVNAEWAHPCGAQPVADAMPPQATTSGPGAELKSILRNWLGIVASPNCSCNARARQMDEWGPDECERRIPEIVTWLEEQAKARNLPFVRFAGEQAVKLAIRRARKKAAK